MSHPTRQPLQVGHTHTCNTHLGGCLTLAGSQRSPKCFGKPSSYTKGHVVDIHVQVVTNSQFQLELGTFGCVPNQRVGMAGQ